MEKNELWDEKIDKEWKDYCKKEIMRTFTEAEKCTKPDWKEMFTDVYEKVPDQLA